MRQGENHMIAKRKTISRCLLETVRYKKRSESVRSLAAIVTGGLCLGLLAVSLAPHHVVASDNAVQLSNPSGSALLTADTQSVVAPHPKRANFEGEYKSGDAQRVADWVVDSGDNRGVPFVIVDKVDARVFVFNADGRLRGAAPALLGLGRGDDSVPDIGNRSMSGMRPEERTTPAGRFVASLGRNFHGKDILWVDYNLALSLHRVVTSKPAERRLERLTTPTPLDNRISYGCINVPAKFYDDVVKSTFTGTNGIVYVLPEMRSKGEIFASYYDVE